MSEMIMEDDFEDIRPYFDYEINPALKRIISDPAFDKILDFLFSGQDKNQIKQKLADTFSIDDFQLSFMHPLVYSILNKTSKGLTFDGFEQLTPGMPYLFVSNHRDIVLDSAIFQILLVDNGLSVSEITYGNNLLFSQLATDLGKVNRMLKVIRGGNKMELFRNSQRLSAYIRHSIRDKKSSIWIAQRPGRTKDGDDKTETGLLKMFNMSTGADFYPAFHELNIVPLAISYEYEPCCALKIKEIMLSRMGTYEKKSDEDLISIIRGIMQPKGRIHLSIGKPVNEYLKLADSEDTPGKKLNHLTNRIDAEIYSHYKCWPNNYIAYDILMNTREYESFYTKAEEETFREYRESELKELDKDGNSAREIFLKMYANPVINLNRSQ
jgi:hypothetical protein